MERARARTKRAVQVQRSFERSRLEDDLVAAAYELAVPVPRRSRSFAQQRARNASLPPPPPASTGGFPA